MKAAGGGQLEVGCNFFKSAPVHGHIHNMWGGNRTKWYVCSGSSKSQMQNNCKLMSIIRKQESEWDLVQIKIELHTKKLRECV